MPGDTDTAPGALALVGSGEYTHAMSETDAYLLETLGGSSVAQVVLLPTASGLEEGSPARWNEMGWHHFTSLGVGATQIRLSTILGRADADDPRQLDLLRGGTFFYFSGGSPGQITESLRDTPAWEIIHEAHRRGAVLAGCSAGAMALGGLTISLRRALSSSSSPAETRSSFVEALGVAPHLITFPHFDRMAGFVGQPAFADLLASIPDGYIALGVDEDTALVRVAYNGPEAPARWRVMGRQTVTVFAAGVAPRVLRRDDEVEL